MSGLFNRILELNAEADWRPEEVEHPDGGRLVFERFAQSLLQILHEEIPGISFACMSLAGLDCDLLQPVATWPSKDKSQAHPIRREAADVLHKEENKREVLSKAPANLHPLGPPRYHPERHLAIKLVGYGEYYGLIWLDTLDDATLYGEVCERIKTILPVLLRTVAEANFSMRLQQLAAPLESGNGRAPTREEIYNQFARQVGLGLAADGAILRLYDPNSKQLVIRGNYGETGVGLNQDIPIRQRISQKVFESEHTIGTAHNVRSGQFFGTPLSEEERRELDQSGVVSFMIMLLQSDVVSNKGKARLGTIAVVHHRPYDFSLRDIRLAHMFAERVADDLALLKQKDELEEKTMMLSVQNNMITRAEVIALLAHDLGHKAIHITEQVDSFAGFCRKAIKDRRSPDVIDTHTQQLKDVCSLMENEINQIRRISFKAGEEPTLFDVVELLDEIGITMDDVFRRNNMTVDLQPPMKKNQTSGMMLYGPRGIFGQAIFNLMLNSVDAQKSVRYRKNIIHVHCRKETQGEKERIIIQYYDDGPGISYHHFPDIKDIFKIGTTSKTEGTGTGLPVSRSLLDRFFKAELEIKERRPPRFEIAVDMQAKTKN